MTYLGIEVNETALLILLAIIAVSLIFIGWKPVSYTHLRAHET